MTPRRINDYLRQSGWQWRVFDHEPEQTGWYDSDEDFTGPYSVFDAFNIQQGRDKVLLSEAERQPEERREVPVAPTLGERRLQFCQCPACKEARIEARARTSD